jgi:hypothetical protein
VATVRDLKKRFEEKFPDFTSGRRERVRPNVERLLSEFWNKLNKLGARNIDSMPPEKFPDIDATVELSPEEWEGLMKEMEEFEGEE